MWFRMCPKCKGDLYLDPGLDGYEIACLQCGRSLRPGEEAGLGIKLTTGKGKAVVTSGSEGRKRTTLTPVA